MKAEFEVKTPNDQQIEQQIQVIIQQAFPKQKSTVALAAEIWRVFSKRELFGRSELLFSILIVALVAIQLIYMIVNQDELGVEWAGILFLVAPFIFLALTVSNYITKQFAGMVEIEMTMKYTMYQLLAIRMAMYSVYAIVVHITTLFVASQFFVFDELTLTSFSLSGLFLFATGMLILMRKNSSFIRILLYSGCWFVVTSVVFTKLNLDVVMQLPKIVYVLVMVVTMYLFIHAIYQMFTKKQGGSYECLSSTM